MPQLSAASSRDRPSKTSAIASIRRAALASCVRAASRRKSPADRSRRVIATAMSASAPGQWRSESQRRPKRGHVRVNGQGAWYQVFLRTNGVLHHLWRAVDQDGAVLDILVQDRRNGAAAKRLFKRPLAGSKYKPRQIIADGLRI